MPDQPPERPTVDLPAPTLADIRHAELKSLISMSIGALDSKVAQGFARVDQNLGIVSNSVDNVKDRLTAVEGRVGSLEGRATRTSDSVKGHSNADLAQEAKIAQEIVDRRALGEDVAQLKKDNIVQLEILKRLDAIFANRKVKLILGVLALAAAGWAARHGITIGIPATPAPAPVAADAGASP